LSKRRDFSLQLRAAALRHGGSDSARDDAARALADGGDGGVDLLLDGLVDKDAGLRARAADALALVYWREIDESLRADAAVMLASALHDRDSGVRGAAARALGRVGGEGAVEALQAMPGDEVEDVRLAVAAALGRLAPNKEREWDDGSSPFDWPDDDPVERAANERAATERARAPQGPARSGPARSGPDRGPATAPPEPLRMIECPGCRRMSKPEAVRCLRCGSRLRP
jgi:HEAT repeat protein